MGQETVVSREYKVMLRAPLFAGDDRQLLQAASHFSQDLKQHITPVVLDTDGDLEDITHRRIITFYDTHQQILHRQDYIFRERYHLKTRAREVTLKFRHPDRYIAGDRRMELRNASGKHTQGEAPQAKTKFEEDIKPPFVPFYSFSTTCGISETKTFQTMHDITSLYDGLHEDIEEVSDDEAIHVVGSPMRELVIEGATFQIRQTPRREAACALIVWYDQADDAHQPVLVEFSFRYGEKHAQYTRTMAQRAYDVFHMLQMALTRWTDPTSETKTAYMYH
jgi:hypothetical protein